MLDADHSSAPDNPGNPGNIDSSGQTGETAPPEQPAKASGSAEKTAKKAAAKKAATKKAGTKKAATKKTAAKKTAKRVAAKKTTAKEAAAPAEDALAAPDTTGGESATPEEPAEKAAAKKSAKKAVQRTTKKRAGKPAEPDTPGESPGDPTEESGTQAGPPLAVPLFQPPEPAAASPRRKRAKAAQAGPAEEPTEEPTDVNDAADEGAEETAGGRRRRRRGGRRRRKGGGEEGTEHQGGDAEDTHGDRSKDAQGSQESQGKPGDNGPQAQKDSGEEGSSSSRRRRRRRRSGENGDTSSDDPENTVTRVRKGRSPEDEITALSGSTRLEAKKQRRREGREAGRRRAPIVSEAEFLARRESVDRVMVIRQRKDLTQIAVLEDKVLVEHYVARESQTSLIGNIYLGRVQNVLPSMEAAFIDIGKGRNAVLYAGEVNWDALGAGNGPRKIEQVLKSGQSVLVQVTKDPVGHKGARLTSQISLPGRFLVYVPDGTTSGISRKLPDTERTRLKNLLKEIVPESAGVIVRTAAEGASEDELTRDVERLTARWDDIAAKVDKGGDKGGAPQLLYGEPDLTLKVVRDLFTEDFGKLVVSGDDAWDMVEGYVHHVAPDLTDRLERFDGDDVFAAYRIDEQIAKALDRKVWLPSGGSLIIDRTEAMTVVDVNTGKFTGSGGNLEETVTKNNLEAAEEIVRQLRLRDIGGIIVVDFIDMVLESNRDLVLRRLVECLGRDRTRHQVAEVTSLGLVQMTRKRIGTGLLEAFSEPCEHCHGRGLVTHEEPVDPKKKQEDEPRRSRRGRGSRGSGKDDSADRGHSADQTGAANANGKPSPKDFAVMAGADKAAKSDGTDEANQTDKTDAAEAAGAAGAVDGPDGSSEAEQPTDDRPAATRTRRKRSARSSDVKAQAAEQPVPEPESQPEPADKAPRVVSSSRRRVARRPAGPPAADGAGGTQVEDEPPPLGQVQPEPQAAAHVPVKKKGSRKR
jgi:ribonuclease E